MKKNVNEQIFREYFNYQSQSIIVKYFNESLSDLRNSINSKKIPGNETPKKVVIIVGKILYFNKQQKGKGVLSDLGKHIKILTPKQILQRLPIALAQVKTDYKSENLLKEIRKIIYSLYREKEITKKVYNNILNSIKL